MDSAQITTTILSTLTSILKCPVTLESSRKNTPQWDSLKHIEVIFLLEDEFGVQFSEDEMGSLDSVRKLADNISARHAA